MVVSQMDDLGEGIEMCLQMRTCRYYGLEMKNKKRNEGSICHYGILSSLSFHFVGQDEDQLRSGASTIKHIGCDPEDALTMTYIETYEVIHGHQ